MTYIIHIKEKGRLQVLELEPTNLLHRLRMIQPLHQKCIDGILKARIDGILKARIDNILALIFLTNAASIATLYRIRIWKKILRKMHLHNHVLQTRLQNRNV